MPELPPAVGVEFPLNRIPVVLMTALFALMLLAGCSSAQSGAGSESTATVGPVKAPTAYDLTTPESAVRSYLDAISLAYRTGVSDVASETMTGYEFVRVDAYIQLNIQEGRAIEQALSSFEIKGLAGKEPTVTVSARETWDYRYFLIADGSYASEELTAAYLSDYTVVKEGAVWKVDAVKVTPQGEVQ